MFKELETPRNISVSKPIRHISTVEDLWSDIKRDMSSVE